MIDTAGARTGQVNGLSVYEVGGERFGAVIRISATTRFGHGEVIDIQRETHLSGPVHAKGVMILSGYIAARYSQWAPAAFAATLAFEQSYGGVDGDSASSSELRSWPGQRA